MSFCWVFPPFFLQKVIEKEETTDEDRQYSKEHAFNINSFELHWIYYDLDTKGLKNLNIQLFFSERLMYTGVKTVNIKLIETKMCNFTKPLCWAKQSFHPLVYIVLCKIAIVVNERPCREVDYSNRSGQT